MVKNVRQTKLVRLLHDHDIMSVSDLSEQLQSSKMTIRRDLDQLEQKGIVRKIHGGAVVVKHGDDGQPSFETRFDKFAVEKSRIGMYAASMIENDSVICVDSGTSTLAIVDHIPAELCFTVITPSLMTAMSLCKKPNVSIIHSGGSIHHSAYASEGFMATNYISSFNADIAFISTKSISVPEGTFEAVLALIEVKRALASIAKRVVLLADHSKFMDRSLCMSFSLAQIDCIITDDGVDPQLVDELRALGCDVIVV